MLIGCPTDIVFSFALDQLFASFPPYLLSLWERIEVRMTGYEIALTIALSRKERVFKSL